MVKVKKIKREIQWKPVELDGALFNNLDTEGLVGIEECTNYDLLNSFGKTKKIKKKKRIDDSLERKSKKLAIVSKEIPKIKAGETTEVVVDIDENLDDMIAWSSFGLPQSILKSLQLKGFTQPTQIQSLTLPAAIFGSRDILGAAETGSGKTLAFGLPILTGILNLKANGEQALLTDNQSDQSDDDEEELIELGASEIGCVKAATIQRDKKSTSNPLYALILTPTRELAVQIKNHLIEIAKYTGIHVALVVGGMAAVKQERILNKGPEIVVATPGRLWELIQQGNSHLSQVDNIRFLAIDETDRMLEKGHFEELHNLMEKINQDTEKIKRRQNFVFSATLTLVHELPKYLIKKMKKSKSKGMSAEQKLKKIVDLLGITDPKIIDITQGDGGISTTLTECRITCSIDEKDYYVYYFLQRHQGRTLIFCNSIGCVRRLSNLLGLLGCRPLPLHASMQQRQRLKNLERFKDDEKGILVATDVAARGLDIPSVEHVLHYQTPRTSESYVHRSGRTARATKEGITILLMEPSEIPNYIKLCKTLNKDEDLPTFPVQENFLKAVKERVNLARELDKLELGVRKANSEEGWLQKAAKDMDIVVDDFIKKYDTDEASSTKKTAASKRKQLERLLAKPIFPKDFNLKFPLSGNMTMEKITKLDQSGGKAVGVMKDALEALKNDKKKKKSIPLYKPKKKNDKMSQDVSLKPKGVSNKLSKKKRNKKKFD